MSRPAEAQTSATIANLHTGQIVVTSQGQTGTSQAWVQQAPEEVRAGVVENLSRWLKEKMTRRLLADRAQLLATQETAKLKVLEVDARLTKIENQIQRRNEEYEKRIDVLLKALVTAEEHNRELIRAQIALLKAEMEKNRLRQQNQEQDEF